MPYPGEVTHMPATRTDALPPQSPDKPMGQTHSPGTDTKARALTLQPIERRPQIHLDKMQRQKNIVQMKLEKPQEQISEEEIGKLLKKRNHSNNSKDNPNS